MMDKDELSQKRNDVATSLSVAIEGTLESFGIKVRVQAVTFEDEYVLLNLNIAPGVKVEDIENLRRTLAVAVAAPTGEITMQLPIPGTSQVGIIIPGICHGEPKPSQKSTQRHKSRK